MIPAGWNMDQLAALNVVLEGLTAILNRLFANPLEHKKKFFTSRMIMTVMTFARFQRNNTGGHVIGSCHSGLGKPSEATPRENLGLNIFDGYIPQSTCFLHFSYPQNLAKQ